MKRNNLFEKRRKAIPQETRDSVRLSFAIVDRIHEILTEKGLKQKDLAVMLGKSEAEISRWMRGTHNFTIDTLIAIGNALGEPIVNVTSSKKENKVVYIPLCIAVETKLKPQSISYCDTPDNYTTVLSGDGMLATIN